MKLSLFLVEKGYFPTRSQAHNAIKEGKVTVNGNIITKDGFEVDDTFTINVKKGDSMFVSRGGNKLEAALKAFEICLDKAVCLDIGASTGGFTDCCLKHGAEKVYAYDVGHDQLVESLKNDPRVIGRDGINCRNLTKEDFNESIDFICMDVSFISCRKMFNAIADILPSGKNAIILFKPQFEVGSRFLNNKGVVKDKDAVNRELANCKEEAKALELYVDGIIESPIKGQNGNQEYLLLLRRG